MRHEEAEERAHAGENVGFWELAPLQWSGWRQCSRWRGLRQWSLSGCCACRTKPSHSHAMTVAIPQPALPEGSKRGVHVRKQSLRFPIAPTLPPRVQDTTNPWASGETVGRGRRATEGSVLEPSLMSSAKQKKPSTPHRSVMKPSPGGVPGTLWRCGVVFVAALGIQLLLILFAFQLNLDRPINRATAQVTAWAIALVGVEARAEGDEILCPSLSNLRIIFECTGAFPAIIFVAAVVAYPCRWRFRLAGAAVGVLAILAVNELRLMTLLYVGYAYPDAMEWVHLVAWQALFVVFVVMLWTFWAMRVARLEEGRRA